MLKVKLTSLNSASVSRDILTSRPNKITSAKVKKLEGKTKQFNMAERREIVDQLFQRYDSSSPCEARMSGSCESSSLTSWEDARPVARRLAPTTSWDEKPSPSSPSTSASDFRSLRYRSTRLWGPRLQFGPVPISQHTAT